MGSLLITPTRQTEDGALPRLTSARAGKSRRILAPFFSSLRSSLSLSVRSLSRQRTRLQPMHIVVVLIPHRSHIRLLSWNPLGSPLSFVFKSIILIGTPRQLSQRCLYSLNPGRFWLDIFDFPRPNGVAPVVPTLSRTESLMSCLVDALLAVSRAAGTLVGRKLASLAESTDSSAFRLFAHFLNRSFTDRSDSWNANRLLFRSRTLLIVSVVTSGFLLPVIAWLIRCRRAA
mmetsp:Transcript_7235/g.16671  ORF Transcript_7235/g.16671 Transcript_7235/m.16671 type:complete len:231 (+) Transcript_7235:85-777(+)